MFLCIAAVLEYLSAGSISLCTEPDPHNMLLPTERLFCQPEQFAQPTSCQQSSEGLGPPKGELPGCLPAPSSCCPAGHPLSDATSPPPAPGGFGLDGDIQGTWGSLGVSVPGVQRKWGAGDLAQVIPRLYPLCKFTI